MKSLPGTHIELGLWFLADGRRGVLEGEVQIEVQPTGIVIRYGDGRTHQAELSLGTIGCAPLTGDAGDGMIYLSEHTMILDYTANIEGQIEHNTDVWDAGSLPIRRSGVIRQPDRLIWYESKMSRADG